MGKPEEKLKKIFIFLGVTGAVYGAFRFLLPLVVPFFAAWGLAALFGPSAGWVSAHLRAEVSLFGKKRSVGISIGMAGMAEVFLVFAFLLAGTYLGSRKLCLELMALKDRIPVWIAALDVLLTEWCHQAEGYFELRNDCLVVLAREMLKGLLESMKHAAMPFVMANSMTIFRYGAEFMIFLVITIAASGMAMQEMGFWKARIKRSAFQKELELICGRLLMVANAYLKTQGLLLALISFLCMVVFWLLKNPFYILAGLGTGILDALPVFGTGTALIPWAIIMFLGHRWEQGLALLALYLACYFLRQVLESKLMAKQVGLMPFEELAALFVGLRLFGILGIILGPVGVLLVRDLTECIEEECLR